MGPLDPGTLEFLKELSSSLTTTLVLVVIIAALAYVCVHLYRARESDRQGLIDYNRAMAEKFQIEIREINERHNADVRQMANEAVKGLEANCVAIRNLTEEIRIDEKLDKLAAIKAKLGDFK